MSYKHMPRLGSAIASTILSVFWAVSLVGVDKAQAAILNYTFDVEDAPASGFFKVNNSTLTGIGYESIAVSEGRAYNLILGSSFEGSKEYYNLAGFTASFYEGDFLGLNGYGYDTAISEYISPPDEPGGPYFFRREGRASWSMAINGVYPLFSGYREVYVTSSYSEPYIDERRIYSDVPVFYTLVNTEPEPVPEPLTAGGTALALAGLSWLKHKKKMAA
jgi:hypothetical protein